MRDATKSVTDQAQEHTDAATPTGTAVATNNSKIYSNDVLMLKEIFPGWSAEDLDNALRTYGDLDSTTEAITKGS